MVQHLVRMEETPGGADPGHCWRDYISGLSWERLGIPPEELVEVAGEREGCLGSQLRLWPPRPGERGRRRRRPQLDVAQNKAWRRAS